MDKTGKSDKATVGKTFRGQNLRQKIVFLTVLQDYGYKNKKDKQICEPIHLQLGGYINIKAKKHMSINSYDCVDI